MPVGINLLPWRANQREQKNRFFKKQIIATVTLVIMILLGWQLLLEKQIKQVTKNITQLQQQLNLLGPTITVVNKANEQQQKMQQNLNLLSGLQKQHFALVRVFEKIHRGMADDSYLTKIVFNKKEIKLFGRSESVSSITRIMNSIILYNYSNDTVLQKIARQGEEYEFVLSLPWQNMKL